MRPSSATLRDRMGNSWSYKTCLAVFVTRPSTVRTALQVSVCRQQSAVYMARQIRQFVTRLRETQTNSVSATRIQPCLHDKHKKGYQSPHLDWKALREQAIGRRIALMSAIRFWKSDGSCGLLRGLTRAE